MQVKCRVSWQLSFQISPTQFLSTWGQHLQLMLLMHFVQVYSQTCYTECLKISVGDITNNRERHGSLRIQFFLQLKAIEFNALYPTISVTLVKVPWDDMVNEAQQDLESEYTWWYIAIGGFLAGFDTVHCWQRQRGCVADHRALLPFALRSVPG